MLYRNGIGLIAISAAVAVSRVAYWPVHPPNFDFANFALGLARFSPQEHQPHPPGYPLVIALGRLFRLLGAGDMEALLTTALVGTLLALLGAWTLGRALGGHRGAWYAALLVAANPILWYSAVTSPVRIYLAAGACCLSAAGIRLLRGTGLLPAFALAAIFAGFRPELAAFFLPAFWYAAWRGGFPPWRIVAATGFFTALCVPWLVAIVAGFGSVSQAAFVVYHYFRHHAATTSALMGAPPAASGGMLADGLIWNALTLAPFAAAAIWAGRGGRKFLKGPEGVMMSWYALPALAIQLAVHMGTDSPDHAAGTAGLFAALTGVLLAQVSARRPTAATGAVVTLALAMAATSVSPGFGSKHVDLLSLPRLHRLQETEAAWLRTVGRESPPGTHPLVFEGAPVGWRIVAWKLGGAVFLEAPLGSATAAGWDYRNGRLTPVGAEVMLPAGRFLLAGPPHVLRGIREGHCAAAACSGGDAGLRMEFPGAAREADLAPYRFRW